jgi:LPS sulfotransferase NodH
MEPFILLADRRSGTTLVIDCLNNHPRIHCEKRAFGIEKKIENPTPDRHSGGYFLYRTESLGRRIRHFMDRAGLIREYLTNEIFLADDDGDVRGVRLIYNAAEHYTQVLDLAKAEGIKVLHLVRENVLKTYVSHETAPLHKMHHPREGAEIKTVKLHVDVSAMLGSLERRAARIQAMRDRIADIPHLEVTYESFVADRDAEGARILPFLGVDVVPMKTDLVKINPDTISDVIDNYDEVSAALAGTPFARFLA